jgi:hypothetical protein
MSEQVREYTKSFEDELDWNLLEQLHKVVLQISSFCFRTKQICITIEIALIGLLIKFTDSKIDTSVFVAGFVIPLAFWFLDSIAYYYQVKLRGLMNNIQDRLKKRNIEQLIEDNNSNVIDSKRVEKPLLEKIKDSLFNHSMWFYYLLLLSDTILWISYKIGWIK